MGLILRALRVKQWTKNVLVFAAPAAAGVLLDVASLVDAVVAFFSLSFAASSLYVFNDIRDVEADRLHPRKSERPFASGRLSIRAGYALAAVSAVIGGGLAFMLPQVFGLILLAYVVNTLVYTLVGKRVATVDMLQVALGFVLRAVAGAAATGVELSQWFLGVAMFGSLLMVAGKRSAEVDHLGDGGETRSVLRRYSPEFLHQVTVISATALLITYALWALGDGGTIGSPWALVSFAPFLYAVLRYVQLSDMGETEEPETLVLADRGLMGAGAVWAVVTAVGIYS